MAALLAPAAGCDVYDPSLLGGGAAEGAAGGGGSNTGASGGGGSPACEEPADCGVDSECGTHTCEANLCVVDAAPVGTVTAAQMDGDCIQNECDGQGNIAGLPDDDDLPVDGNECTSDRCDKGIPDNPNRPLGSVCADGFCNANADCVECVDNDDCPSDVCTDTFECAPASCDNNLPDAGETDIDCGGNDCPGCPLGDTCLVGTDCLSMNCGGVPLVCIPPPETCVDLIENQDETDIDCGGVCDPCLFGQGCLDDGDCETGNCGGSLTCSCAPNNGVLLFSEIRTRGPGSASNEIIELYNPGNADVTLSSAWVIEWRPEGSTSYGVPPKFTGSGQVVPPGRHFLIGGSAYVGPPTADFTLAVGISDDGSLVLKNGAAVVDAVCFGCGADVFTDHICEGTMAVKMGCSSNIDKSIERKPGAALGNCVDTQDNGLDFAEITPSIPENLASPSVP